MNVFCVPCIFQALVFVLAANGAPILFNLLLGNRLTYPVDGGLKLADGYRLFGKTKTWRGFCSAVCFTTGAAILFGWDLLTGAVFGALTMTGDLLASFIKRRLGKKESCHVPGLDTVPESLLPIMLLKEPLALANIDMVLIVFGFFLIEEFVSPLLYKWHIRNRPY